MTTRVLICIPNLHGGGAERLALQLFRRLDRDRFAPRLFVHERQGVLLSQLEDSPAITFQHQDPYHRGHLAGSLRGTIKAARDADVIIGANEGRAAFLALLAARVTRKPLILWLHTNWSEFRHRVSWRQMLALRQFGRADAIVACSDGVANAFTDVVPGAADKLRVIHNGCPIAKIQRRAALPIPPTHEALFDRPVIITAGRLSEEKGHDVLIHAHAQIIAQGLSHRLILLGEGCERARLEALTDELGVADSVHLLGFQENPFSYFARADIFALSSHMEGFGLVLVEAMASGLPVVSTECPSGPKEILARGTYGRLVPVNDPQAMAQALAGLLLDPAKRDHLAAQSANRAQSYEISSMLSDWQDLIAELHQG